MRTLRSLRSTNPWARISVCIFVGQILSGCSQVPEDAQFDMVADEVHKRSGLRPQWTMNDRQKEEAQSKLDALLAKSLTEESVVQIALLNNPGLQARYSEWGIALADLIQAGLFSNPSIGGLFKFPTNGKGPADLTFTLTYNFLNLLTRPLRQSVAESEFEETRLRMIKLILETVSRARSDYYKAVGAQQLKHISDELLLAAEASYQAAKALRNAGNITELDMVLAEAALEQAKVDNESAAQDLVEAISRLALSLGIEVSRVPNIVSELPMPKDSSVLTLAQVEENSIDLALNKQHIETLGRKYNVSNLTSLIPELRLGGELERKDGDWEIGPALEFSIPLLDQGQATLARAKFEICGAQDRYKETLLKLRATSSTLDRQLQTLGKQIVKMHDRVLPLADKALKKTLLQYNAMTKGITDLLLMKKNQIEAHKMYTELLIVYWLTHTAIEQLKFGSLPERGVHP